VDHFNQNKIRPVPADPFLENVRSEPQFEPITAHVKERWGAFEL
jgi:hypothetical protein